MRQHCPASAMSRPTAALDNGDATISNIVAASPAGRPLCYHGRANTLSHTHPPYALCTCATHPKSTIPPTPHPHGRLPPLLWPPHHLRRRTHHPGPQADACPHAVTILPTPVTAAALPFLMIQATALTLFSPRLAHHHSHKQPEPPPNGNCFTSLSLSAAPLSQAITIHGTDTPSQPQVTAPCSDNHHQVPPRQPAAPFARNFGSHGPDTHSASPLLRLGQWQRCGCHL